MTQTIIWTIVIISVLGLLLALVLFFIAEVMKKVAAILGYEVKEKAPMVAVVRCNGSCENRPRTNSYDGYPSCKVKAALYSGDTGCAFGCLGCGDCVAACQFGALSMDPVTGLPVVDGTKCTACGACTKACPRHIMYRLRQVRQGVQVRRHHRRRQSQLHRLLEVQGLRPVLLRVPDRRYPRVRLRAEEGGAQAGACGRRCSRSGPCRSQAGPGPCCRTRKEGG